MEKYLITNTPNTVALRNLKPGQELRFICESPSELDSATQIAYKVKREGRTDGYCYKVARSATTMVVSVTLNPVSDEEAS